MISKGDVVYAIVKNNSFQLEVVCAQVKRIEAGSISVEQKISSLISYEYTFPENEIGKSIFFTNEEAEIALKNRIKNGL